MRLFDVGGKFKPRHVAGVASARFIEPHGCEEIDEWRKKFTPRGLQKNKNSSSREKSTACRVKPEYKWVDHQN